MRPILKIIFAAIMVISLVACGSGIDDDSTGQNEGNNGGGLGGSALEVNLSSELTLWNDEALTLSASATGTGDLSISWTQTQGPNVTIESPGQLETRIQYTPEKQHTFYQFQITVNDANSSITRTIDVKLQDRIYQAGLTGNPVFLPSNTRLLERRILQRVESALERNSIALNQIFDSNAIFYDPTRNSRFFYSEQLEYVFPLVTGNLNSNLVSARWFEQTKAVAFGTDIFSLQQSGANTSFNQTLSNIIQWLWGEHSGNEQVVKVLLVNQLSFADLKSWFSQYFPNATVEWCNNENELHDCLSNASLIITGSRTDMALAKVMTELTEHQNNLVPLMYVHQHGWNSSEYTNPILDLFGVYTDAPGTAGNFYRQDIAEWSSLQEMMKADSMLNGLQYMFKGFVSDQFDFDISNCNETSCSNIELFAEQFYEPASKLKALLSQTQKDRINIFDSSTRWLEKLALLLADRYRETVSFPMSKNITDTLSFLQSYYADHVVSIYRNVNPVPASLGNFSRTNFSHITPTSKIVSLKSGEKFRSAGVYALPGQTFTVTRIDSENIETSIFINTLRSGAVKEFEDNNYVRPKFVQSEKIIINPGETLTLSTPYGGPVQIGFKSSGVVTEFEFTNVGLHPYWRSAADNEAFLNAVNDAEYDWTEVANDYFEVHSQLEKMQQTLTDSRWSNGESLSNMIEQYIHQYPHELAGYQGDGIALNREITDFAELHQLTIEEHNVVKHMNADQPLCGYGCSGNPYDAGWFFEPLGHGDLHELGHGLEENKLKPDGFEGHATTNYYSYYSKYQFFAATGEEPECQSLDFAAINTLIQQSRTEPDPFAFMQAQNLSGWKQGTTFMMQVLMSAQNQGALLSGWNVIPRLHILLREFDVAKNNDSDWLAKRTSLGFSLFSRADANTISNNDFLLVALSYVTERDWRDYFNMWGLPTGAIAQQQVLSFSYRPIDLGVYAPEQDDAFCKGLNHPFVAFN